MSKHYVANPAESATPARPAKRSLWPLIAVLVACVLPVVAAVSLYFNPQWMPQERSNYGAILEPQRPVPAPDALRLTDLDGKPVDLRELQGQWLLVTADQAACPEACARKLFIMRQSHASTGKNVVRIERVWFITDAEPVPDAVKEAYVGTHMLRVTPEQLQAFMGNQAPENHIWVIDPLGNLMMQFPQDPDPTRLRRDIGKLLFASQIG